MIRSNNKSTKIQKQFLEKLRKEGRTWAESKYIYKEEGASIYASVDQFHLLILPSFDPTN
jgi:NMD protein affecting ribosome stability and mRNA decay